MNVSGGFQIYVPRPGILKVSKVAGSSGTGDVFDDLHALGPPAPAADGSATRWWPDSIQVFRPRSSHVQRLCTTYRREPAIRVKGTPLSQPLDLRPSWNQPGEQAEGAEEEQQLHHMHAPPPSAANGVTVQVAPDEVLTCVAGFTARGRDGGDVVQSLELTVERRNAPPRARGRELTIPEGVPRKELQAFAVGTFSFQAPQGFAVCALWGRAGEGAVDALSAYYACQLPAWDTTSHRLYPNAFRAAARILCQAVYKHEKEAKLPFPKPLVHVILDALARQCYFEFGSAVEAGWGGDVFRGVIKRTSVERGKIR